jgi:cyclopropane-fatty-acyl-phospholipid synthase
MESATDMKTENVNSFQILNLSTITWVLATLAAAFYIRTLVNHGVRSYIARKVKNLIFKKFSRAGVNIGKDLLVHDEKAYLHWTVNGSLGFGESYVDQLWDVGSIPLNEIFYRLMKLPAPEKRQFKSWNLRFALLKSKLLNLQSLERSQEVAKKHYDLGNDFYQLMLDKNMQYSCGYWKNAEDLDQAQENKMKLIAEKLKLEPGMTVMDIGSGWGYLSCYLAENYKVHVTAANISKEQVEFCRNLAKERKVEHLTNFLMSDYRNVTGEFDRLVTVGFCEHVGYRNIPSFIERISKWLKPGGLALIHTIGNGKTVPLLTDQWVDKYIFPGGYLPSPKLLVEPAEGKLFIEDLQNIGPDYVKTLQCWQKRFMKAVDNNQLGDKLNNPNFIRMWNYYLHISEAVFRARICHLYQIVYSKGCMTRYDAAR